MVDKLVSGEDFIVSKEDAARVSLGILAIVESASMRMPVTIDYGTPA